VTAKTILIVEDNEVQREGLAAVLQNEGYSVVVAADGKEALSVVGTILPDLILIDMMMPPPDGWGLMRLWKQNPALASVPVVIMTSLGIASEEWAASLGACGLIRKPVEMEPLLREVRRCIGERHG
jgi:CheY-like chemotaxis protein